MLWILETVPLGHIICHAVSPMGEVSQSIQCLELGKY